jgi:hypothetical protein
LSGGSAAEAATTGAQVIQAVLNAGVGMQVDRVREVVPFLALQAPGARAQDIGSRAVVAAPVVADGGQEAGAGVLFVLVARRGR